MKDKNKKLLIVVVCFVLSSALILSIIQSAEKIEAIDVPFPESTSSSVEITVDDSVDKISSEEESSEETSSTTEELNQDIQSEPEVETPTESELTNPTQTPPVAEEPEAPVNPNGGVPGFGDNYIDGGENQNNYVDGMEENGNKIGNMG